MTQWKGLQAFLEVLPECYERNELKNANATVSRNIQNITFLNSVKFKIFLFLVEKFHNA